jgi:thioredoxin-related protein
MRLFSFVVAISVAMEGLCFAQEARILFPERADGELKLENAVRDAARESKRVLVSWGVNSSAASLSLDKILVTDEKAQNVLESDYIFLRLNSDQNAATAESLQVTVESIPTLTVVDPFEGTQVSKSFADSSTDPADLLAFLYQWKPKPTAASKSLDRARQDAARKDQAVFVLFTTTWCQWCKRLKVLLGDPEIAPLLDEHMVYLEIDQEKTAGGRELRYRLSGDTGGSIPWVAVVDNNAAVLATSTLAGRNIGYPNPSRPKKLEHFLGMIRTGAPALREEQIAHIADAIRARGADGTGEETVEASDSRLTVR